MDAHDGYPNRDSLGYRGLYGLTEVETLVRGTLRSAGFSQSWDVRCNWAWCGTMQA